MQSSSAGSFDADRCNPSLATARGGSTLARSSMLSRIGDRTRSKAQHIMVSSEASKRLRVLVVDDDPVVCDTMRLVLRGSGFVVAVVAEARQTLARALHFQPDVALVDGYLDGMTGVDVVRALRGEPASRAIRIVALSGVAERTLLEDMRRAGADAFLTKPASLDTLLATIRPQP